MLELNYLIVFADAIEYIIDRLIKEMCAKDRSSISRLNTFCRHSKSKNNKNFDSSTIKLNPEEGIFII